MGRTINITLFSWLFCTLSYSQENNIDLSTLKAPSFPASLILGITPSEIAQPKSHKALEAALYSNFLDENNSLIIPNDYALEFSPYWMFYHQNLSFDDYINPTPIQTLPRNLAVSVASTQSFVNSDSAVQSAIGIGLRTVLDFGGSSNTMELMEVKSNIEKIGRLRSRVRALIVRIIQLVEDGTIVDSVTLVSNFNESVSSIEGLARHKDAFRTIADELKTETIRVFRGSEGTTINGKLDDVKMFLNENKEVTDEYLRNSLELATNKVRLQNVINDRSGFKIEFALAMAIGFPDGDFRDGYVPKWGIWVTPSYQIPKLPVLDFLGVFRSFFIDAPDSLGIATDSVSTTATNTDVGFKIVFKKPKFSIYLEGLYRWERNKIKQQIDINTEIITKFSRNDHQMTFNVVYNVNDNLVLGYSIGRGFEFNLRQQGNFISILSFALGLGGPTVNDFQK